jgi:hypothetical protein
MTLTDKTARPVTVVKEPTGSPSLWTEIRWDTQGTVLGG